MTIDAMTASDFGALVDHTLLAPTATGDDVRRICGEALRFGTAAVCVNPVWVSVVAAEVDGASTAVCAVAGFPLGAEPAEATAATIRIAVTEGADEIDVVMPLGFLLAGETDAALAHLETLRAACADQVLKVIIESAVLTDSQIVKACELSVEAGADFVKTSTGFHASGGASVEAVALMRQTVGPSLGVKASGGIRTLADVEAMVAAGASRLGMSATAAVVAEIRRAQA